jgi:small subunit ribosomal protein S8
MWQKFGQLTGSTMVNIPSQADVYDALSKGMIDWSPLEWEGQYVFKRYEVTKYGIDKLNMTISANSWTSMCKDTWNSLPADIQAMTSDVLRRQVMLSAVKSVGAGNDVAKGRKAFESGEVKVPASRLKTGIAEVLKQEGYIVGYDRIDDSLQGILRIHLKYGPTGQPAITTIRRESKPGCRDYRRVDAMPDVLNGLGISIISTSHGVLSDRQCKERRVGGELLCTVS